jgi:hypothetical protein
LVELTKPDNFEMMQSYKDQLRLKRSLSKNDTKFLRDLNYAVGNAGEHLNNGTRPDQFYWSNRHSLPAHFRREMSGSEKSANDSSEHVTEAPIDSFWETGQYKVSNLT